MLLDEEEEEHLKNRQQAFLRTRRVKRSKAHADEFGNGSAMKDDMMIDTSTSVNKKKETISPAKPKKMAADLINGTYKSAPQNIFATIKTSKLGEIKQTIPEEDDSMEEDEEDDPETLARKKLLKLLEQGDNYDDDEDGVAIEYNSGDEGAIPANGDNEGKSGKANAKTNNDNGDLDDDDIMGDEY